MSNEYTLFRAKTGGWIVIPRTSSYVAKPDEAHVFESAKSLAEKLPRIIDPEAARKLIESLPQRGEKGKFLPKKAA